MSRLEVALAFGLLFAGFARPQEASGWKRVEPPLALAFPRDHGAHPDFRTEWWYVTGNVEDERGARFGFQLTLFRNGLDPSAPEPGDSPLRAREVYAGHLVVSDVGARRTVLAERLRRASSSLVGASDTELDLALENWSLARRADGVLVAKAADPAHGIGLELELAPRKPLVLHGTGGYSRKGPEPGNASVYASWTRLAASGTLAIEGRARPVRGAAWFDHEWGTSQLGAGVVGWDWFALQLEDGRELALYALRRTDGMPSEFSSGTLVEADGTTRHLARGDFTIEALATWKSPRTRAEYPARWRIVVASAQLDLELEPLVPDSELDTSRSTGVVYWEGPVAITRGAQGRGYAELVGYAGSLAERF